MSKFLKVLLLLLLITALVWLSTLWRWQKTHVDPSVQDLVLHLLLLPLALTAAMLLWMWGGKKIREAIEAPKQPPTVSSSMPPHQSA